MKNIVKLGLLALPALMMIGCGSNQLSIKMGLVSTSPKVDPAKEVRKENRTEEFCSWSLFSVPLGDEATPAKVFNKINDGAYYVNDLAIYPKGFDYKFVAKSCWAADGVAALSTGAN